jgi:hypothetical protein
MSEYVHHVPGRLRVRCGAVRRNPAEAAAARARLLRLSGVLSVEVRTLTGSVTIHYTPGAVDPEALLAQLGEAPRLARQGGAIEALGECVADRAASMLLEKLVERSALALLGAII